MEGLLSAERKGYEQVSQVSPRERAEDERGLFDTVETEGDQPPSPSSDSPKPKKKKGGNLGGDSPKSPASPAGARKAKKADEKAEQQERERLDRWKEQAEKGELCAYTCLALAQGRSAFSRDVFAIVPNVLSLLALQAVVPCLLLSYEMKGFTSFPTVQKFEFRIIGFCLYLYSLRNMYHNALDECRKSFMELAFTYNLNWHYIWPVLLGEVVNSFAAFTLSVTLFSVFCEATHPQDLIINCIAINFIGSVDIELMDDEMMKRAVTNFDEVMGKCVGKSVGEESAFRQVVETSAHYLLLSMRVLGTLCFGTFLAFIFLLSHSEAVCTATPFLCVEQLCPWVPWLCLGGEGEAPE
mmetsp:Transcript_86713/g.194035  ORF Transcript_86713/g.194035 Transcript_86713/m.194035 type:complete len:354 (+) Transcript_86713:49-1110(+)